jgi:hypothetical protein
MRLFVLFAFVILAVVGADAALQTYAFKYRFCDFGEIPRKGSGAGEWTCYTACVPNDAFRSQPCRTDLPLNGGCPGFYRTSLYDVPNASGFFLTARVVCIYPLVSQCAYSEQIQLCNHTTANCLRSDYFTAPQIRLNGSCDVLPQYPLVAYANHEYLPCTRAQLQQACYADERDCAYDNQDSRLLFRCPWTPAGTSWGNNHTVPSNVTLQSPCTDIESETVCAPDWRTRVPREPCTRRITQYTEYVGHTYAYDISQCNRRPCTAAEQLTYCGFYTSGCWLDCPRGLGSQCTLRPGACDASLVSSTPARYCTEDERLQTCVEPAAVASECRVRCESTDLQSGCALESRCLATQGYPQHTWNTLSLIPNVTYICSLTDHSTYCRNSNALDPFRLATNASLCRKICGLTFQTGATGVCALRDAGSCSRVACTTTQQMAACVPSTYNSLCSALAVCSNYTNASAPCSFDPQCPVTPSGSTSLDSFESSQIIRQCKADEFALSCAPFVSMCRVRCPTWDTATAITYDTTGVGDLSACIYEQKCSVGQVAWQTFDPSNGATATTVVRACTTPEYQQTCAEVLAECKASCPADDVYSPTLCNITAYCPWSFGFISGPFIDPNPRLCSPAESTVICGPSYVSPCTKYACVYTGYTQTYTGCIIDPASCNVRACTPPEQTSMCGYYTHTCQTKCTGAGVCTLVAGTCGAYSSLPARPCTPDELLDSCAAFDLDCRVQCLNANLTVGCAKSNICPWTAGQWIYDQFEPVPYTRGDPFLTAVFCGPGWVSDNYNNACEKYQCTNTRRLGRHDCECHYSTCYCPFR